jgi:hypothetical protein
LVDERAVGGGLDLDGVLDDAAEAVAEVLGGAAVDHWTRQALINEANRLYGRRAGGER